MTEAESEPSRPDSTSDQQTAPQREPKRGRQDNLSPGKRDRSEGGFAPTFKEAVGRWRRRHRHPPANESWFAVHYRVGWLVERLSLLESIHLLRQGLDVRSLESERPARRKKGDHQTGPDEARAEGIDVEDEPPDAISRPQPRSDTGNAG